MKFIIIKNKILYLFHSLFEWFVFYTKGVKFKANCYFNGSPYFYKTRKSQIIMGVNCRFNSRVNSTLLAVNH